MLDNGPHNGPVLSKETAGDCSRASEGSDYTQVGWEPERLLCVLHASKPLPLPPSQLRFRLSQSAAWAPEARAIGCRYFYDFDKIFVLDVCFWKALININIVLAFLFLISVMPSPDVMKCIQAYCLVCKDGWGGWCCCGGSVERTLTED